MASARAAAVRRHLVLFDFAPLQERSLPTRDSVPHAAPDEPQLLALTTGAVVWTDEDRSEWAWCERSSSGEGARGGAGWAPRAYLQAVEPFSNDPATVAHSTPTLAAFEHALAVLQRSDSTRATEAAAARTKLEAEAGSDALPLLPRNCWFSPLVATALCSVRIDELASRLRRLGGRVARWEFVAIVTACFSATTRASFRPDRLEWHLARLFDSIAGVEGCPGSAGSETTVAARVSPSDVLAVAVVFDGGCVRPGMMAREIFDARAAGAGGVLSEAALERHLRCVFSLYIDTCEGYGGADSNSDRSERAAVLARAVSRHAYRCVFIYRYILNEFC